MLIDLKSLNKAEQNTKEPENQPVLFSPVPECRNLADPEIFEAHIRSESGNMYKAYYKGYYETDVELQKSITQSALSGSFPIQTILRDIQKQSRISE